MKIILQSIDRFMELGEFNTCNNSIIIFNKGPKNIPTFGSYSYYEYDLLSIHSDGESLFALFGRDKMKIGPTTSAKLERYEGYNILKLFEGGKEYLSYKYVPKNGIEGDMTPFHEEEDNDYFIFMANIINSPDRQAVILERVRAFRQEL